MGQKSISLELKKQITPSIFIIGEEYYNKHWNNFRWKLMFKLFLSKSVVGKFGRDKEFFRYAEKDISKEMKERSRYALCVLDSYENPYIHYIMMGNYRLDCLPYFLRRENFENIKKRILYLVYCGSCTSCY